jgi:hypothetical protein
LDSRLTPARELDQLLLQTRGRSHASYHGKHGRHGKKNLTCSNLSKGAADQSKPLCTKPSRFSVCSEYSVVHAVGQQSANLTGDGAMRVTTENTENTERKTSPARTSLKALRISPGHFARSPLAFPCVPSIPWFTPSASKAQTSPEGVGRSTGTVLELAAGMAALRLATHRSSGADARADGS